VVCVRPEGWADEGLISVKPSRRPVDGAAMVLCTLLGCISDRGGLMAEEAEGVLGGGEDSGPLPTFWALFVARGFSSCSYTAVRSLGGAAGFWTCDEGYVSIPRIVRGDMPSFPLFTRRRGEASYLGQTSRAASRHCKG